ncbi:MAG: TlpA disulfide reductase family protein [Candidatus Latescibacterota bacterium]
MAEDRADPLASRLRALKAASGAEMDRFYREPHDPDEEAGPRNPRHRWAEEYYRLYLEHRPAPAAGEALRAALKLWPALAGVSRQVEEAVAQVPADAPCWARVVARALFWSFYRDGRLEEGVARLERLAQHAPAPSLLLYELGVGWLEIGEREKAREALQRVVALDERDWYVELLFAGGYLHEMDQLNLGQEAPAFTVHDTEGRVVRLADLRGRAVVLCFWSGSCGACGSTCGEWAVWERLRGQWPPSRLALLGFCKDGDPAAFAARMRQQGTAWPQVCEGRGWADTVFHLYNITGVPSAALIDAGGRLAGRHLRDDQLEGAVRRLLSAEAA